jgi:hypothetical protein
MLKEKNKDEVLIPNEGSGWIKLKAVIKKF